MRLKEKPPWPKAWLMWLPGPESLVFVWWVVSHGKGERWWSLDSKILNFALEIMVCNRDMALIQVSELLQFTQNPMESYGLMMEKSWDIIDILENWYPMAYHQAKWGTFSQIRRGYQSGLVSLWEKAQEMRKNTAGSRLMAGKMIDKRVISHCNVWFLEGLTYA